MRKDDKILKLIRDGKESQALDRLYRNFPQVRKLILSKGGNEADAKDVFQEALIIFVTKARKPDFKLTAAISTYVYSCCRFIWKDKLIKKNREVSFEQQELLMTEYDDVKEHLEKEAKFNCIDHVIDQIGGRCKEILINYYYKKMSMKKIAEVMGFSSDKVAKNQKYKCIERARSMARDEIHHFQNQES